MTTRGTTRRKILDLAETLLQQVGYNGFSYHHISSALGIKNAAIHYHFPSKEDLGLEIIDRTKDRFYKWINHPENRILPATQQMDWFIKSYQYNLNSGHRVCLIGALATDYYTLPPAMRTGIDQLSSDIQKWLSKVLDSGRQTGELTFEGSSQDKSACLISSLTGSLQLARLLGIEYFHKVVNQIYIDLKLTYA